MNKRDLERIAEDAARRADPSRLQEGAMADVVCFESQTLGQ